MKIIIFKHRTGLRKDDYYEEEMEFEDGVTEEEINDAYLEWILQEVGEDFTWYEKAGK